MAYSLTHHSMSAFMMQVLGMIIAIQTGYMRLKLKYFVNILFQKTRSYERKFKLKVNIMPNKPFNFTKKRNAENLINNAI